MSNVVENEKPPLYTREPLDDIASKTYVSQL